MIKSIIMAAAIAGALVTPASAFIDLGFVDSPGTTKGYEARIWQFGDNAQPVDYWYATHAAIEGTSFQHTFGGTTYWLTLASDLGLALYTAPTTGPDDHHMTPGVPEPATWALLLTGFLGISIAFRQRRRIAT